MHKMLADTVCTPMTLQVLFYTWFNTTVSSSVWPLYIAFSFSLAPHCHHHHHHYSPVTHHCGPPQGDWLGPWSQADLQSPGNDSQKIKATLAETYSCRGALHSQVKGKSLSHRTRRAKQFCLKQVFERCQRRRTADGWLVGVCTRQTRAAVTAKARSPIIHLVRRSE